MMDAVTRVVFIVWHRRAGKDLLYLNGLVARCMMKKGNYFYILPQQNQVRRAIWEGITKEGKKYLDFIPEEIIYARKEAEMKIIFKDPEDSSKPGSILSFIGGDNYDALAGAGISGCVISEFALQKMSLYMVILRPMLKETGGFCWINTTPRGMNHAYDLLQSLKENEDDKNFTSVQTILDTKMLKDEDLDEDRKQGVPEEIIQQEYFCSFEGAIHGSYYGDLLKQYEKQRGDYGYDARYPVHTAWDLGISDAMAIWFFQFVEGKIHIIDYYENTSYGLQHYVDVINRKGFLYASHNLPHDGGHRALTATEKALTIKTQIQQLGLNNIVVHSRTNDVYSEIMGVRSALSRIYWDLDKTKDGYEAIKQYRREFDEKRNRFKDTPLHDWCSHASDAFRLIPRIQPTELMRRKPVQWKRTS